MAGERRKVAIQNIFKSDTMGINIDAKWRFIWIDELS